jgi:SPP1 family predicted phage head-tail adaptor
MNRRITIAEKFVTRDAFGGESIAWQSVGSYWAAVLPIRGREYVAIRDAGAEITTRFVMHYRAGITPAMRIEHQGALYDIIDVIDPEDGGQYLEIMARAEAVPS